MKNDTLSSSNAATTHELPVDISKILSENTNVGYFKLNDAGKLEVVGFDGLYGHRAKIEFVDNLMLISPREDLDSGETVLLDDTTLSNPIMIDYFKQANALNCLFVRVWNVFTQCKGVCIYD